MILIDYQNFKDRNAAESALAKRVAQKLDACITRAGSARLAVPGGTTPAGFLTRLGISNLDWRRVTLTPTDERRVPQNDLRSNFRMIRETFAVAGARPQLTPMTEARALSDAEALDVCVLGMGVDSHCASLFPRGDNIVEALRHDAPPATLSMRAPDLNEDRLTFNLSALAGAASLHLLIFGDAKRRVLEDALASPPGPDAPIHAVLAAARNRPSVWWAP